jgi:AcrR family transcriptional regulator
MTRVHRFREALRVDQLARCGERARELRQELADRRLVGRGGDRVELLLRAVDEDQYFTFLPSPSMVTSEPRACLGHPDRFELLVPEHVTVPPMPRPRTFDEDRALDAAMRTFWANGYEATTTEDLCAATGLGRSSIYNTFSSKHELFRRSLLRYVEMMTTSQLGILEDEGRPPMERLRALFSAVIDGEVATRRDGRSIGCLTVNTTVELSGRDPEAAEIVGRDVERRAAALRIVIAAAQRAGEITSGRDPDALARYLNAVIGGMRVAGQGGADRAALQSIADTALDALVA